MEYMIARITDVWLMMDDGRFTNNLLDAKSFDSFEEAKKYIVKDTIVIKLKPNYIN